jgi:hypothetical protein
MVALWLGLSGCSAEIADADELADAELGEVESELSRNALSSAEQSTVLRLVDNICGDTWCSGDFNFRFDRIVCQTGCGRTSGHCRLEFRMFPYDATVETGPTYARSCRTAPFHGLESLVSTSSYGYQSLEPDYYEDLTNCIARIESRLPRAY